MRARHETNLGPPPPCVKALRDQKRPCAITNAQNENPGCEAGVSVRQLRRMTSPDAPCRARRARTWGSYAPFPFADQWPPGVFQPVDTICAEDERGAPFSETFPCLSAPSPPLSSRRGAPAPPCRSIPLSRPQTCTPRLASRRRSRRSWARQRRAGRSASRRTAPHGPRRSLQATSGRRHTNCPPARL